MRPLKQFLKSPAVQIGLVKLATFYIRFVYFTAHKTHDIHPDAERYMRGDDNAIFAFWHGRMLLLPTVCPPKRQMHVLISHHRDGVLISDVIGEFKQKTIAGSTSKGGREALMNMLRALKNGDNLSVTPDGPRGPNQILTDGIITTAKLSGKAILPATYSARNHKRMRSWDKFMLAYPFSQLLFCVGEPIMIDRDADDEAARVAVESAMNQLVELADAAIL